MWFLSPLFLGLAARFLVSCVILWFAAQRAVRYAERLSAHVPLSSFGVGALFFAITSALPEISICFNSILSNTHELSMGNLVGSSFMNATIALGIPLLIGKTYLPPATRQGALKLALAGIALSTIHLFSFAGKGPVLVGVFLMCASGGNFLTSATPLEPPAEKSEPVLWLTAKILFYLVLVFWAGHLTIPAVVEYANQTGISLEKAGATLMLFDTTLPEMMLNIQAARHGTLGLALGNSLCSIILQTGLLAGTLTWVHTLTPSHELFKLLLATVAGLMLLILTLYLKNKMFRKAVLMLSLLLFGITLFYL